MFTSIGALIKKVVFHSVSSKEELHAIMPGLFGKGARCPHRAAASCVSLHETQHVHLVCVNVHDDNSTTKDHTALLCTSKLGCQCFILVHCAVVCLTACRCAVSIAAGLNDKLKKLVTSVIAGNL